MSSEEMAVLIADLESEGMTVVVRSIGEYLRETNGDE